MSPALNLNLEDIPYSDNATLMRSNSSILHSLHMKPIPASPPLLPTKQTTQRLFVSGMSHLRKKL